MKHMPGFISASIHKSYDGSKVVNYAQWNSREDFEAMTRHPDAIPHMKASAAMARFDPILCEVVDSISTEVVEILGSRKRKCQLLATFRLLLALEACSWSVFTPRVLSTK